MRKALLLIIVGVGAVLAATSVPANALIFPLDVSFSGTAPVGDSPWLTATFEDSETNPALLTNHVRLTLAAPGLMDSEFVSEWYFNFSPSDSFGFPDVVAGLPYEIGTLIGQNNNKADGESGMFDMVFQFVISDNPNDLDKRFTFGKFAVYEFTGTGAEPLTAESFNFLNEDGDFYSAAHIQAIGESDNLSGWIAATESISAIPEPATILLLGTGLAGLLGIGRFRFKNN